MKKQLTKIQKQLLPLGNKKDKKEKIEKIKSPVRYPNLDQSKSFLSSSLDNVVFSPLALKQESSHKPASVFTQSSLIVSKSLPVSTKQWMNSIYSYNKNFTKNLPSADKLVRNIIKDFLGMNPLALNPEGEISKLVVRRFRRLSLNRIFISKPEIKHTSTRAYITVYLFNKKKISLLGNVKDIYKKISYKYKNKSRNLYISRLRSFYAGRIENSSEIKKYVANIVQKKKAGTLKVLKNTEVKPPFNKIYHSTKVMYKLNRNTVKPYKKVVFMFNRVLLKLKQNFSFSPLPCTVTGKQESSKLEVWGNKSNSTPFSLQQGSILYTLYQNKKQVNNSSNNHKDNANPGLYFTVKEWKNYDWVNNKVKWENNTPEINNNWKIKGSFKTKYLIVRTNALLGLNTEYTQYSKNLKWKAMIQDYIDGVSGSNKRTSEQVSKLPRKPKAKKKNRITNVMVKIKTNKTSNRLLVSNIKTKREKIKKSILIERIRKINDFIKNNEDEISSLNGIDGSFNQQPLAVNRVEKLNTSVKEKGEETGDKNLVDLLNLPTMYKINYLTDIFEREVLYLYYTKMICYNNEKYKTWFILWLKDVLSKIYNKKVNLHLVSLKYIHLNTDTLLQAIAVKLRNFKKNRINKVLRKAFKLVSLSRVNVYSYHRHSGINKFIQSYHNRFTSLGCDIFKHEREKLTGITSKKLNKKAKSVIPYYLKHVGYNLPLLKGLYDKKYAHQSHTISFIRHKSVFGIRLEAGGRLTKRTTASRAVFKIRSKGNLRNNSLINRKDTGCIIGNHRISHLQFTKISSKNRNGAFGIKGWLNGN